MKGKLKKWLKEKGKDTLGDVLETVGSNTSIPILSSLLEGIGEKLQDDPDISPEDMAEFNAIKLAEIELLKVDQQEISKRWASDMASDNRLAKSARPITLHFISVLLLSYFVVGYCGIYLPTEYTSLLIVIVPTVYGGYFALREFGKHSERKNK